METKNQNETSLKHQETINGIVSVVSAAIFVVAFVIFLLPAGTEFRQNMNTALLFEMTIVFFIAAVQLCFNEIAEKRFYKPHMNARMILCSACLLTVALLIHSKADILWIIIPFVASVASCLQTFVHKKPNALVWTMSLVVAFIIFVITARIFYALT